MVFPTNLKHVALAALALVSNVSVASAQEEEEEPLLRVMFINNFADKPIDLYWENHAYENDHPERRKLEARIAPRGGWHASDTFVGHGKLLYIDQRSFMRLSCVQCIQLSSLCLLYSLQIDISFYLHRIQLCSR